MSVLWCGYDRESPGKQKKKLTVIDVGLQQELGVCKTVGGEGEVEGEEVSLNGTKDASAILLPCGRQRLPIIS